MSLEHWSHPNIILIAVKVLSKYVLFSSLCIVRVLRPVKTDLQQGRHVFHGVNEIVCRKKIRPGCQILRLDVVGLECFC